MTKTMMNYDVADGDAYVIQKGDFVKVDQNKTLRAEAKGLETDVPKKKRKSTPWSIGCGPWCHKYFWEGQLLLDDEPSQQEILATSHWGSHLLAKYRRPISLLLPALFFHFIWWCIAIRYNLWHLFNIRYAMSITMVFGSMIAGMTSEGGGAVAFPVMTLVLGLKPSIARDFSMIIQACGMSAAAFSIFFMGVQIEWNSIIISTLGGGLGLVIGLEYVDPLLTPPQKKMGFVSLWFSFAFALFFLNRYHKRKTFRTIPYFSPWKGVVVFIAGIFGGMFTSFAGSGLDICSFSVLTLLFRVSEKTATPTSVILMGINSLLGAFWRLVIIADVNIATLEYVFVCVPIVVLGAPFGSIIGSHFHRQVLAGLVYIVDIVSLITAFALVPQTPVLIGLSIGLIIGGGIFFLVLTRIGQYLLSRTDARMKKTDKHHVKENNCKQNAGFIKGPDEDITRVAHF